MIGKKIYISGATGLAGSNIKKALSREHQIYDLRFDLLGNDLNEFKFYLKNKGIDMVIHCAGVVGGIKANVDGGHKFYTDNKNMGLNLVNAAVGGKVPYFLNLSSSCAYSTDVSLPLKESDYLDTNPYSNFEPTNKYYALAKQQVSRYVQDNYMTRGMTLVPCNLYGIGDNYKEGAHLIPDLIKKFYNAKRQGITEVTLYGNGRQERQLMDAANLAATVRKMIRQVFTNGEFPASFLNVCPPEEYNTMQIATKVASIIGWQGTIKWSGEYTGIQKKTMSRELLEELGLSVQYTHIDEGLARQITDITSKLSFITQNLDQFEL